MTTSQKIAKCGWLWAATMTLAGAVAPTIANAQRLYPTPTISYRDRLQIRQQVDDVVKRVAGSEVQAYGQDAVNGLKIGIEIEYNEAELQKDAKDYYKQVEDVRSKASNQFDQSRKQLLKEIESFQDRILKKRQDAQKARLKEAIASTPDLKSLDFRFGRLNVDLDKGALKAILEQDERNRIQASEAEIASNSANTMSLSVAVPSTPVTDELTPDFQFNPALYIKKILIDIVVPDYVDPIVVKNIKKQVNKALELDRLNAGKGADWIKVGKSALPDLQDRLPPPSIIQWVFSLFRPNNLTIGIVTAAIAMALAQILGVLWIGRAMGGVAKSIKELKPPEESSATGGGEDGLGEETAAEAGESEGKYDAQQTISAMTSDMKSIRTQLEDVIKDSPQAAAEVLRNMFYQDSGLSDMRDLMGFAGYTALKDALNRMPRSAIDELKAYIEDSKDEASSLLNGVEVAQRVYRNIVTRITGSSAEDSVQKLRDALINTEDDVLATVTKGANAEEVALFMTTLSVERGNKIMKDIPKDVLKEATALLDAAPKPEIMSAVMDKLTGTTVEKSATSKAQQRFIMRLVKGAPYDQEDSVKMMIPSDDWELKRMIMLQHFMFSDLQFLNADILKKALDGFEIGTRAEVLHAVDSSTRGILLNAYPEGSKLREAMTSELEEIGKNAQRQENIVEKKSKLIDSLMNKIQKIIQASPRVVDTTLEAQAQSLGIPFNAQRSVA
jgi:hypothetical protein